MVQFAAPTLPLLSVLHVREPFFLSLHFFTWTANFAGRASIFDESLVVATVAWTTLLFRRIVHSVAWVVLMVQFTVSRFLGCSACVSSSFRFVSPSHFALACSLSTCLSVSLSLFLFFVPFPPFIDTFSGLCKSTENMVVPCAPRRRPRPAADFPGRRSDHASSVPFR